MPARIYRLEDGTRVPGTTTIIGRFKPSEGLLYWAWNEGIEGRDFRESRDKEATVGTVAHAAVEAEVNGNIFFWPDLEPDLKKKAEKAVENWRTWRERVNFKPLHTEISLISEKHRYGGTMDIVEVEGEIAIGDYKNAGRIYSDNLIQLAAYGMLYEEVHGQPIGSYHLMRFSKERGDWSHFHFEELDDARELFLLYRKAYDLDKSLKKRV